MRRPGRLALALALALVLPAAAGAETARVRSGDHPGFTRLVVQLAEPAEWRLGRVEGGYALEVARTDLAFDLSGVFRLISRSRLATVRQEPGQPRLTLELACDCHATAMDFNETWIVLDVRDGPAPAGSAYETAFVSLQAGAAGTEAGPPEAAMAEAEAEAEPPALAAASTMPRLLPGLGGAGPGVFIPARPAGGAGAAAPELAEGAMDEPAPASGAEAATGAGHDVPASAPALPGNVAAAGRPAVPEFAAWESEWQRRLDPVSPEQAVADRLAAGPDAQEAQALDPAAERIAAQETQLLEELARAAAQGLLEADLPALDRLRRSQADMAASGAADTVPLPAPEPPAPEDHVRLAAETSIDRDSGASTPRRSVTDAGIACLPDANFDVAAWDDAGDPAGGITARRQGLVGEFDRPDPDAVLALARYYIALGFGAEAKATLAAFETRRPEAAALELLAAIVDGESAGLPGLLAGQSSCDGRVALWSTLAEGGPHPGDAPNQRAIIAAFSALPLHLRRNLGPDLAARFLAQGDRETAIRLRNAIARAPGEHGDALELLDARLALAEGDPGAPAAFEALVAADDGIAAEAYRTYLETELDAGRVPHRGAETAAALAFEIAGTETGAALAGLGVRGMLASGDFEAARLEILRLDDEGSPAGPQLWSAFADGLAQGAQDGEFLRQAFAARDRLAAAGLPGEVATALARRLTGLGFPEEALRYLPSAARDEAALIARAEALIGSGAPAEAFGTLVPLNGPAAERLRARALLALGDARGAAERFAAAGDPASAERTAWIAGAWDLLATSEDPALRRLAEARQAAGEAEIAGRAIPEAEASFAGDAVSAVAGAPAADDAEAAEPGRVAAARAALAAAEAKRETVEGVLNRTTAPADPS
ncbi:MAG: hypothetical protein OEM24_06530 [Paracoccaceae bacterium]|nr:hypothetical protein [Paracoccaceae bacterium]